MVQNDKKLCLPGLISQEPYIIWLIFMVHMCIMIISPGGFFIFPRFWFFRLLGLGKSVKNGPKWQKNLFAVMYSGYLGDRYTGLGAQTLTPKKHFLSFYVLFVFQQIRWSSDQWFHNASLFRNGTEYKNADRRKKQWDKKETVCKKVFIHLNM